MNSRKNEAIFPRSTTIDDGLILHVLPPIAGNASSPKQSASYSMTFLLDY
jgi:hypothetical protein